MADLPFGDGFLPGAENLICAHDQVSCYVDGNKTNSTRPGHAQRQDSGYFDMPEERSIDSEQANQSFVVHNNRKCDYDSNEAKQRQYCSGELGSFFTCKTESNNDYHGCNNSELRQGVAEDVRFHVSSDVLLDKCSPFNKTFLPSQRNDHTVYYDVPPINSKTCSEPSFKTHFKIFAALSTIACMISNTFFGFLGAKRTINVVQENHKKPSKINSDIKESEIPRIQMQKFPSIPQRCSEKVESVKDVQEQVFKLYFMVKMLCLAVFFLSVITVFLFYKVHNIQCPDIHQSISRHGASLGHLERQRKIKQHVSPAKSERDSDLANFSNFPERKLLPESEGSDFVSPQQDIRLFDPAKDDLFWLETDVPPGVKWSPDSMNHVQSHDETVYNEEQREPLWKSGFIKVSPSTFTTLQTPRDEIDDGDDKKDVLDNIHGVSHDNFYGDDDGGDYDNDADDYGEDGDVYKDLLSRLLFSKRKLEQLSQRDFQLSLHRNWTTETKSMESGIWLNASSSSSIPTFRKNRDDNPLIRRVRSVNSKPTMKPKKRSKKRRKGKGQNKNNKKDKKWSGNRRQSGFLPHTIFLKITSETFQGNFGDHFVMHKHFIPHACITVKRWPEQPKICRDQLVRFEHADTPLGFFKAPGKNDKLKWKQLVDFDIETGEFRVLKPGMYFLQAHLYFEDGAKSKSHWLAIFHNKRAVLACPPGGFRSSTNVKRKDNQRVCQISGIVQLQINSTLEIRTMEPKMEVVIKSEKKAIFYIVRIRPTK